MTWDIGFLLLVLVVMVYFFMTEKLPVELTAFIGLLLLVFTGYVPVSHAFTGFSSPAVMTMFAIFFISGALLRTGVATHQTNTTSPKDIVRALRKRRNYFNNTSMASVSCSGSTCGS